MDSRRNRIASAKVSAGYRTYFLDLERHGEYGVCLVMSESKRLTDHQFERHRIIVDNEHLEGFVAALQKLLNESGLIGGPGKQTLVRSSLEMLGIRMRHRRGGVLPLFVRHIHEHTRLGERSTMSV
jgi:Protein of unknown function (DUF3276)